MDDLRRFRWLGLGVLIGYNLRTIEFLSDLIRWATFLPLLVWNCFVGVFSGISSEAIGLGFSVLFFGVLYFVISLIPSDSPSNGESGQSENYDGEEEELYY